MTRWRSIGKVWCSWPAQPKGLIELIGGSYLSATPHICYKRLLEGLIDNGFAIHAWRYIPGFDHQAQANDAWRNFRLSREKLKLRIGVGFKPIRLGHSLGCKLHLLAPDGGRNSQSLIAISFNNFKADQSIPMIRKVSSSLGIQTEFSPNPDQTIKLIIQQYHQEKNLLIRFRNDELDQSHKLLESLKQRNFDSSSILNIDGNHLTPASTGLRNNLLGEWADDSMKRKNLNHLITTIINWSSL